MENLSDTIYMRKNEDVWIQTAVPVPVEFDVLHGLRRREQR